MRLILTGYAPTAMLLIAILPGIVSAHHSTAFFSRDITEMEGKIVQVDWRNPHVSFILAVSNEEGQEEFWNIEAAAIYHFERQDVTQDLFRVGAPLKVAGGVSKYKERAMLSENLLLENGREVLNTPSTKPRFGGTSGASDEVLLQQARTKNTGTGFFRVWSRSSQRLRELRWDEIVFREEAVAARSDWDPLDNYVTRCDPPGMPDLMLNPFPVEFIDNGPTIEMYAATNNVNVVRTIHMRNATNPAEQEPSLLGYSVGRWEGSTLIVETTRVNFPYFDNEGTPQGEALKTVETFTLSEDTTRLDYQMTATEPATITGEATMAIYWLALGETMPQFSGCN